MIKTMFLAIALFVPNGFTKSIQKDLTGGVGVNPSLPISSVPLIFDMNSLITRQVDDKENPAVKTELGQILGSTLKNKARKSRAFPLMIYGGCYPPGYGGQRESDSTDQFLLTHRPSSPYPPSPGFHAGIPGFPGQPSHPWGK